MTCGLKAKPMVRGCLVMSSIGFCANANVQSYEQGLALGIALGDGV